MGEKRKITISRDQTLDWAVAGELRQHGRPRAALLAGEVPRRPLLARAFSAETPQDQNQLSVRELLQTGRGGGPGSLPTSFSPPLRDLPPFAALLPPAFPCPAGHAASGGHGTAPARSRRHWAEPGAERTLCFLRGPLGGLSRPWAGVLRARSPAAPPRGGEEEQQEEEWVSGPPFPAPRADPGRREAARRDVPGGMRL